MSTTEATELARIILDDSEAERPMDLYTLNVHEVRTLAHAVDAAVKLADELREAAHGSYQEGADDFGDAYQAAATLIRAALDGGDA